MCWLHLGEYCYNTTFHMSIDMSPFWALYGYDALLFFDVIFGASKAPRAKEWIQESQDILCDLKDNISTTQISRSCMQIVVGWRGSLRWMIFLSLSSALQAIYIEGEGG